MSVNPMKAMVEEFHKKYGVKSFPSFEKVPLADRKLRCRLLEEEYEEYSDAEDDDDIVEIADALTDMLYVIFGTCLVYSIPIEEIFAEVHRSNMTKTQPKEKGQKVEKGKNYSPPNIKQFFEANPEEAALRALLKRGTECVNNYEYTIWKREVEEFLYDKSEDES